MKPVHFIGIGGTGLSAIARILLESGYPVSGSDRVYSPLAEAIDQAGLDGARGGGQRPALYRAFDALPFGGAGVSPAKRRTRGRHLRPRPRSGP